MCINCQSLINQLGDDGNWPPAKTMTFPIEVAASPYRGWLSCAVDHFPCARAAPHVAINVIIVNITRSSKAISRKKK